MFISVSLTSITYQVCVCSCSNNSKIHDGVLSAGTLRCLSVDAEIVRRGSLILFCDYVVSISFINELDYFKFSFFTFLRACLN